MEIVRTVGSGLNNKIVINKPGIADLHAEITYGTGHLMMVEDLGSPAGTFVNNRKIIGKKILKSGDILCFGDHIFPFEEHYPDMLKTQSTASSLDSGADDGEPEDVRAENDAREEEVLTGLSGLKRLLYSLQFPKDRQKLQRLWMLVIASIMLLSLVLPWLSWSNPSNATFLEDDKYDAISGIGMFIDLLEVEVSGASLLYIALYGVNMLLILGTATAVIFYALVALKAWKPPSLIAIRRISQVVLILFGTNFFLQFLRFVWFWLDGDNALVISTRLGGSGISEARVYAEYYGIGYWLCGFGVLLVLRSTRNGLWRPNFSRRWAPLSFTFWLPYVLLLALVHQGVGVIETNFDTDEYKSSFGISSSRFFDNKEMKERIVQNGSAMAATSYMYLIREYKRDEDKKDRLRELINEKQEETLKKEKRYISFTWLTLHGLLIVSVLQMFRKRIRGTTTLILSALLLLFSAGLCICIYLLLDLRPNMAVDYVQFSVGYGCMIAIAAALGMLGEQFYFYTTRNEKIVVKETADTLDDLV